MKVSKGKRQKERMIKMDTEVIIEADNLHNADQFIA